MRGRIKTIVRSKGFGFITNERGVDYFFHMSHVEAPETIDNLTIGDIVEFEDDEGPKGPFALDVRLSS